MVSRSDGCRSRGGGILVETVGVPGGGGVEGVEHQFEDHGVVGEVGVTNEYVQRYCPLDLVDHGDLSYDPVVFQLVLNALDPATARYPNCFDEYPAPA